MNVAVVGSPMSAIEDFFAAWASISSGMVEGIRGEVDDTPGNKSGCSALIVAIKLEKYQASGCEWVQKREKVYLLTDWSHQ